MAPLSQPELLQRLHALLFALTLAGFTSWIAWRRGYYLLPPALLQESNIRATHLIIAFVIFLAVELGLIPFIYLAWLSFQQRHLASLPAEPLTSIEQAALNLVGVFCTTVALLFFIVRLGQTRRREIFGTFQGTLQTIKSTLIGAATWFIAYPWILTLSQLVKIILDLTYEGPHHEQVAVRHIKEIMPHISLFYITLFAVILVIPFLEELLFRGFLQTWLKNLMGPLPAIFLTAFLFALFHFSTSQGIENIEILLSLFLLSCYLGFLREKRNSLSASIALHSTFNAISLIFLLKQG